MKPKSKNVPTASNDEEIEGWEPIVELTKPPITKCPVILPPKLQQFAEEVAVTTQTPVDMAMMVILSVISTAMAKKLTVDPFDNGSWTEIVTLYLLSAMRSGERKSAIFKQLIKPLSDYELVLRENHKKSGNESPPPSLSVNDVTPESLAVLMEQNGGKSAILAPDIGLFDTFNGRFSNMPSLDIFLDSYDGHSTKVERISRPSIFVKEPVLTIGIMTQPEVLNGLPKRLVDRGFLGRFLYTCPEPLGVRELIMKPVTPELRKSYEQVITQMLDDDADKPIQLTLDEECREPWIAFYNAFEKRLNGTDEFNNSSMRSWANKFLGNLLRIMALLHAYEHMEQCESLAEMPRTISHTVFKQVIEASEYFVDHAKIAFGCFNQDDALEDAAYLLDVLRSFGKEHIRKQEVWIRTKSRFTKGHQVDSRLQILAERGYIRIVETSSESGLGRKGKMICLNPAILPTDTPKKSNTSLRQKKPRQTGKVRLKPQAPVLNQ